MKKTLKEVLSDNVNDPRLRQTIADETLQHSGHFKAVAPSYCPDHEFFLPNFHKTAGDERTPTFDRVLMEEQKDIKRLKAKLRVKQKKQ